MPPQNCVTLRLIMGKVSDAESWEKSRSYLSVFGGNISPMIGTVRGLLSGALSSIDPLLLKSIRVRYASGLLLMCQQIYSDADIANSGADPFESALKLFGHRKFGHLFSLLYLARRGKAVLGEQWAETGRRMQLAADVSVHLCREMPAFDLSHATLVGAGRKLAYALMSREKPKALNEYENTMKQRGLPFNLELEIDIWGCTHCQVLSRMLADLGFQSNYCQSIQQGLNTPFSEPLGDLENQIRIAASMIESLILDIDPPQIAGDEKFMMDESKMEGFMTTIEKLRTGPSSTPWLEWHDVAVSSGIETASVSELAP